MFYAFLMQKLCFRNICLKKLSRKILVLKNYPCLKIYLVFKICLKLIFLKMMLVLKKYLKKIWFKSICLEKICLKQLCLKVQFGLKCCCLKTAVPILKFSALNTEIQVGAYF